MIKMQLRYLPNIVTGIRFLLIGPILWALSSENYRLALYLFLCAGISDAIDGLLARLYGWASSLGALLDPLADKLLLIGSFVVLAYRSQIPMILAMSVIGRDLWIMFGAGVYHYYIGPLHYQPVLISKINTFLQLLLIVLLLMSLGFVPLSTVLLKSLILLVLITTFLSFFQYTWIWGKRAVYYCKLEPKPEKDIK